MSEQEKDSPPLEEQREVESAPSKSDTGPDVHSEALSRFKQIIAREEGSRVLAVGDLVFIDQEGGTYDESVGFLSGDTVRTNTSSSGPEPPPPRYQIDRISPVIEEAVSDQRESQINIQVRGVGDDDPGLADTYNGLIKNIEIVSDAQDAYDGGFDEGQKSGYGGWQIVTRFADDSFEHDIIIEPVVNATQSMFFGPAKKSTKEDALYAFLIWDLHEEEFKIQWPKAVRHDWPEDFMSQRLGWFNSNDKMLRLAAYWRKRSIEKEIIMVTMTTPDGKKTNKVIGEDDLAAALEIPGTIITLNEAGEEVRRTAKTYQVERFILNGAEILEDARAWPGKYIPLIPEYGVKSVVNKQEIIRGKVRKGKDAQRIYNYTVSSIVETAALAPKDFHWMTAEQAEDHTTELEKMNVSKNPIQFYTHVEDVPVPFKGQGPTVQQALIDQRNAAKEDISASVGAGVGVTDGTAADPRSGEAIREGNVSKEKGNSIYFTNHLRAISYTGLQLADLISKLWTSDMQRRIIKPDGEAEFVPVNQTVKGTADDGQATTTIVNDLSQGRFDIVMDVGPAYASQRQQGADQLTKLAIENPAFAQHTPDLIAKALDIPDSKELHDRLRKAGILAGQIEPTDEEREKFGLNEREQLAAELEPEIREKLMEESSIKLILANTAQFNAQANNLNAASAKKEAEVGELAAKTEKLIKDTEKVMEETVNTVIEGMGTLLDTFAKKIALGIPLTVMDHDTRTKQEDLIEDEQQDLNPGPSSALETEIEALEADTSLESDLASTLGSAEAEGETLVDLETGV